MRQVIIKTEGDTEPITTAVMKTYVGYLGSDDDTEDLIESMITSARLRMEHFCGRNFVEKTMILSTSDVGINVPLPYGPVYQVDSVKVYDSYGDLDDTLTADDDYYLIGEFDKYVRMESWFLGSYINIEYKSGYHSTNTYALPEAIKMAIKRQVKYDYDHRGSTEQGVLIGEVRNLLMPYVCLTV